MSFNMGKMSTRMISASSHSKTAFSISMNTGDAAARVAECDIPELEDSPGRASSSPPIRCSQPKKASPSTLGIRPNDNHFLFPWLRPSLSGVPSCDHNCSVFIYSVHMECHWNIKDWPSSVIPGFSIPRFIHQTRFLLGQKYTILPLSICSKINNVLITHYHLILLDKNFWPPCIEP